MQVKTTVEVDGVGLEAEAVAEKIKVIDHSKHLQIHRWLEGADRKRIEVEVLNQLRSVQATLNLITMVLAIQ